MRNGGYKIIDLSPYPLTDSTELTIPGIYDRVEGTRKAVMVSGLSIADTTTTTEFPDFFALFAVDGTDLVYTTVLGDGSTLSITIADDDGVTASIETEV